MSGHAMTRVSSFRVTDNPCDPTRTRKETSERIHRMRTTPPTMAPIASAMQRPTAPQHHPFSDPEREVAAALDHAVDREVHPGATRADQEQPDDDPRDDVLESGLELPPDLADFLSHHI